MYMAQQARLILTANSLKSRFLFCHVYAQSRSLQSSEYRILWDKILLVPTDAARYANPAILLKLPFPNLYHNHPWRYFQLDGDRCFESMGRSNFLEIYEEVVSMETSCLNNDWRTSVSLSGRIEQSNNSTKVRSIVGV
jgi:hypothetical protein